MSRAIGTFAVGLGAALAVAAPAALLAQVLDAVVDGDLSVGVTAPLALVVLAGAGVGGWAAARHRPSIQRALVAAVGAVAMGLVAGLGAVRQAVADEEVRWAAVPAAIALGAVLAFLGAWLSRRPGRTRP